MTREAGGRPRASERRWLRAVLVTALVGVTGATASACFVPTTPIDVPVACVLGSDCLDGAVCFAGRCLPPDMPCLQVVGREAVALPDGGACGLAGDGICVAGACVAPFCGDDLTTAPETCDGTSGCRADCTRCGDGVIDGGELCDDGDANSDVTPGACRSTCVPSSCGDGVKDPGEGCDDGAANSDRASGACRTSCAPARCGDGALDDGEGCDDGAANSDDDAGACRTTCVAASCGDGTLDGGEACDDGRLNSDVAAGACRRTCVAARCGDSVLDPGEGCDDGDGNSDVAPDACRTSCAPAACGDGIVDGDESCDDGAGNSDATVGACRTSCAPASCGDGVIDSDEECDDGDRNSNVTAGACRTKCRRASCGDATTDPGEGCDDGERNSDLTAGACRRDCRPARCGDGVTDAGEECDDGAQNNDGGPGACRTTCRRAACGDAVVDPGEACDDGDANSDVTAGACRTTCALPSCGDGTTDPGEACDEGAANSDLVADACRTTCARAGCGDVVLDAGEACDDGDGNDDDAPDACRTTCVAASCGDGVVDAGEACDDGRLNSDVRADACRTTCVAASCGDGALDLGEECDRGDENSDLVVDGCRTGCVRAGCGDGVTDSDEACDDGSRQSGDGCRADCGKVEGCGDRVVDAGEDCDDGNANPVDGCDACRAVSWSAALELGVARTPRDPRTVGLSQPLHVAVDGRGGIIWTEDGNIVRRLQDGVVETIAGSGVEASSGDGDVAAAASVFDPLGVAVDFRGRVAVSELTGGRVRVVGEDGRIRTAVGTGAVGLLGDGLTATVALVVRPAGVAFDGLGRLYLAESGRFRVRRVELDGRLVTVLGVENVSGNDGDCATPGCGVNVRIGRPFSVAFDPNSGRMYVGDSTNAKIRALLPDGSVVTVAGGGALTGDGVPAGSRRIRSIAQVAVAPDGDVLFADVANHAIERIEAVDGVIGPSSLVSRFVGTGVNGDGPDGAPPLATALDSAEGVAVFPDGRVVIGDGGNGKVRVVAADGSRVDVVAGTGLFGDGEAGLPGLQVPLVSPRSVRFAPDNSIVFPDNANGRVLRVDAAGRLDVVVADTAVFAAPPSSIPGAVAFDAAGRLYVALANGPADPAREGRIVRLEPDGTLSLFAGTGAVDDNGVPHPAIGGATAPFFGPDGALYAVDLVDDYAFRVDAATRAFSVVAGTTTLVDGALVGQGGFAGDGGPATAALLNGPSGVAVQADGTVLISDTGNFRIRAVDPQGNIRTIAGNGTNAVIADGALASAAIGQPAELVVEPAGTILFCEFGVARIRRIRADGTLATIVGNAALTSTGDGGDPLLASSRSPQGFATRFDVDGALVRLAWTEERTERIRVLEGGVVRTVVGLLDPPLIGPGRSRLPDARQLVRRADGRLIAATGRLGRLVVVDGSEVTGLVGYDARNAPNGGDVARFFLFGTVAGLVDAGDGRLLVTDTAGPALHAIDAFDADPARWTVQTVTTALGGPAGLAPDGDGVLVADVADHCVRRVDVASGEVVDVFGRCGVPGFDGDGGAATDALLFAPEQVLRAPDGALFIADTGNHRVRLLRDGVISTVLGTGVAGRGGIAQASTRPITSPVGLHVDPRGNLWVATPDEVVVVADRDDDGSVDGDDVALPAFAGSDATLGGTRCLSALLGDGDDVLVADRCSGGLVRLRRTRR